MSCKYYTLAKYELSAKEQNAINSVFAYEDQTRYTSFICAESSQEAYNILFDVHGKANSVDGIILCNLLEALQNIKADEFEFVF